MSIETTTAVGEQEPSSGYRFTSLYEHMPPEMADRLRNVQQRYDTAREMAVESARDQIVDTVLLTTPELSGRGLENQIQQSTTYQFRFKALERARIGVTNGIKIAYGLDETTTKSSHVATAASRMAQEKCEGIDAAATTLIDTKLAAMRSDVGKAVVRTLRGPSARNIDTFAQGTRDKFDDRMDTELTALHAALTGYSEQPEQPEKSGWKLLEGMRRGGYKLRQVDGASRAGELEAALSTVEQALGPIMYSRAELIGYVNANSLATDELVHDIVEEAIQSVFGESAADNDFRFVLRGALRGGIISEMRNRRTGRILLEPSGIDFDGTRTLPHASKEVVVRSAKPDTLVELSTYLTEREKVARHRATLAEGGDPYSLDSRADTTEDGPIHWAAQLERRAIRYVAERRETEPGVSDGTVLEEISRYLHPDIERRPIWEGGWLPGAIENLGYEEAYKIFHKAITTT